MSAWRRQAAVLAAALGPAGWAGVALIAAACAGYFAVVAPVERARDAARAEAVALQDRYRMLGTVGERPGSAEQLATFYGFFPGLETTADWVGKIFTAAEQGGLTLLSGEYRLTRERDARLARYQIVLPVRGSYLQIRKFVARVLADVPAAALDEITLKRDSVGAASLEARIKLTLYLGSGV